MPTLWWRSVGHSHTRVRDGERRSTSSRTPRGQDPLEYRRALLHEHPRHLGALNLAAEKAGWGKPLPAGRAPAGSRCTSRSASYVAQVAEVSVDGGRIRVHRVVCAIDCGIVVNPDGVRGADRVGASSSACRRRCYGGITFKDGRVEQSNFHDYPVLRMPEMPVVEVHIVPSTEKSGRRRRARHAADRAGGRQRGLPPDEAARLRRLPFDLAAKA